MDVEIITIGDELLLGQTLDSNAAYIAKRLVDLGLAVRYKSTVGDSIDDMEDAFKSAVKRAGVIVTTGGLGPTDDDRTKKAVVKVFKRRLVFDEKLLEDIKARYKRRDIEMPAINQNQALIPGDCEIFKNRIGSAVGIGIVENDYIFISLPGVPSEMRQILDEEIVPFLAARKLGRPTKVVTLKTTGIVESRLAEIITDGLQLQPGVKLAYLPTLSGVNLRVISTGDNAVKVDEKTQQLVTYIEKKAGRYIYGSDDDTLESIIGQLLQDNDRTLAVAESCTGGQLGKIITSVPGASSYFAGGIVAYSNAAKVTRLGVKKSTIEKHGAVSEETALEMARGCRNAFQCDYALSITGISGPDGGTEEKPVGTTLIGLSSTHNTFARKFNLGVDRNMNRTRACYTALELLRREILDID